MLTTEEKIIGIVNELGFIVKSHEISTDLGQKELLLQLDIRMSNDIEDRFSIMIRNVLGLRDCPRVGRYPKENLLYPVAVDLYD
jgi:hypothetical protein